MTIVDIYIGITEKDEVGAANTQVQEDASTGKSEAVRQGLLWILAWMVMCCGRREVGSSNGVGFVCSNTGGLSVSQTARWIFVPPIENPVLSCTQARLYSSLSEW